MAFSRVPLTTKPTRSNTTTKLIDYKFSSLLLVLSIVSTLRILPDLARLTENEPEHASDRPRKP